MFWNPAHLTKTTTISWRWKEKGAGRDGKSLPAAYNGMRNINYIKQETINVIYVVYNYNFIVSSYVVNNMYCSYLTILNTNVQYLHTLRDSCMV